MNIIMLFLIKCSNREQKIMKLNGKEKYMVEVFQKGKKGSQLQKELNKQKSFCSENGKLCRIKFELKDIWEFCKIWQLCMEVGLVF